MSLGTRRRFQQRFIPRYCNGDVHHEIPTPRAQRGRLRQSFGRMRRDTASNLSDIEVRAARTRDSARDFTPTQLTLPDTIRSRVMKL